MDLNRLEREQEKLSAELQQHALSGDKGKGLLALYEVTAVSQQIGFLKGLGIDDADATDEQEGVTTFCFSSWMLYQSFMHCCEDEREGMHFILGIEREGVRIGTHFGSFPYEYRSVAGASGDMMTTHRISIQLHEWDHRQVALIHSHPHGCSNFPSSVDRRTQDLWEKTTKIVGGIWDRQGRIRFYSNDLPFKVQIIGNYVEEIDENLYQLRLEDIEPFPT